MTPMRVYVTGGGRGFVGAHVVRALRAAGHEVRDEWVDVRELDALYEMREGSLTPVHHVSTKRRGSDP